MCSVQGVPCVEIENTEIQHKNCISKWNSKLNARIHIVLSPLPGDVVATFMYNQRIATEICFQPCVNGPHYRELYVPGYLYWPRIRYRKCDGMCLGKQCISTQSRQRCQTVCVYKCNKDRCSYCGTQSVTYTEDFHCQCECAEHRQCLHGYMWDKEQCECKECNPGFDDNPVLESCMPLVPI